MRIESVPNRKSHPAAGAAGVVAFLLSDDAREMTRQMPVASDTYFY